jgi:tetratricopeptide (TPR) repeat protein
MAKFFRNQPEEGKDWIKKYESVLHSQVLDVHTYEDIIFYYLERMQAQKALEVCKIAVNHYPYSADFLVLEAKATLLIGDAEKALALLDKAETYQPNDLEAIITRASVWSYKNQVDKAISLLQAALITNSGEKEEIYFYLGLSYQQKNEYDTAIDYFKKTLQIAPDHQAARLQLGICLESQDQLEDILPYLEKAIEEDAFNKDAWLDLASVHNRLGNFEKAEQACEYALAIDEHCEYAQFELGCAFMNQQRYEEALQLFQVLLASKEENDIEAAELCVYTASCYENLTQFDKATYYYKKAIHLDDLYADAWYGMGTCLMAQKKYLPAIHFLKKAIELSPLEGDFWLDLARSEYFTGNIFSAEEAFQKASELLIETPELWSEWSFMHYEQGDYDTAIAIILQGLEEEPENAALLYQVSAYYICASKYQEAFLYLENALILDFDAHTLLFEFFNDVESQKALKKIIDQFRAE